MTQAPLSRFAANSRRLRVWVQLHWQDRQDRMATQSSSSPRISIVGLGKLGSPMAAVMASKGFDVIGLDVNERLVNAINEGRAPVQEPQLQEFINRARSRLRATQSYDELIKNS